MTQILFLMTSRKMINLNLISSFLHLTTTKTKVIIHDKFNNLVEVPYKWVDDIKNLEFSELLASSLGPLAIYFGWKKKQKEKFAEIASGTFSSSFVNGEPVTALASISILAFKFSNTKTKEDLRKLKWGAIKGTASIGVFATTTKIMGVSVLSFLIGTCAFFAVRKSISILRLFEYFKFLKKITIKFPKFKKELSRRELLTLKIFTYN